MKTYLEILVFALIPFLSIIIGGVLGLIRKPSGMFTSSVLHFAAGVVFSVVAVELLPDIVKEHAPLEVGIGFSLGVISMFLVKYFAEKIEQKSEGHPTKNVLPMGLVAALAIDLIIDGLLVGVGFAAGNKEGVLLSVAMSFEVFALGLAVTLTCRKREVSAKKNLYMLFILGLTFFIGAVIGITLLSGLSSEMLELVLSFGLAALLFLVTEELLMEAHEEKETPFQTACFFAGFLLFLIIGMIA